RSFGLHHPDTYKFVAAFPKEQSLTGQKLADVLRGEPQVSSKTTYSCLAKTQSKLVEEIYAHSLWVLCKIGYRMSQMEAELSYIGMCLRYKFVDPERFHHLETLQVGWHRKRKILNDYRNCTRDHLRTCCAVENSNEVACQKWSQSILCRRSL
ncbi:hypothetical protein HPB47_014682, partial [Ixodes persulcatus]